MKCTILLLLACCILYAATAVEQHGFEHPKANCLWQRMLRKVVPDYDEPTTTPQPPATTRFEGCTHNGHVYTHGMHFPIDCNTCTCLGDDVTMCTMTDCVQLNRPWFKRLMANGRRD